MVRVYQAFCTCTVLLCNVTYDKTVLLKVISNSLSAPSMCKCLRPCLDVKNSTNFRVQCNSKNWQLVNFFIYCLNCTYLDVSSTSKQDLCEFYMGHYIFNAVRVYNSCFSCLCSVVSKWRKLYETWYLLLFRWVERHYLWPRYELRNIWFRQVLKHLFINWYRRLSAYFRNGFSIMFRD